MCYCACFKHISTITCQEYDDPASIVCDHFNLICLQYDEEQGISFPPGINPFELYQSLHGIVQEEIEVNSTQSSILSDMSNKHT